MLAHFIKDETEKPTPSFPFLALTISGGHTQIIKVTDYFSMEVLGETIDDAVGEAFDKSAKLLGFPYPGGPLIDAYAQKGNPEAFSFPKPKVAGLNFSFSGLKTSILYFLRAQLEENENFIEENKEDICASIQHSIVSILMKKLKKASIQTGIKEIGIGGGVSANKGIRAALEQAQKDLGWKVHLPKFDYCTDNAAMIGIVGYLKYLEQDFAHQQITAKARYHI